MIHDGLQNPFTGKHMMQEASEVATELELTRPDMDRWALRSHELAIQATDEGRLPEEIVPGRSGPKEPADTVVEIDEAPRRETSLEALWRSLRRCTPRTARTPPATRRASTTGRRHRARLRRVGQDQRKPCWRRSSPRVRVTDDFPYLARTPARRPGSRFLDRSASVVNIDL